MTDPLISLVMAVYNGDRYLKPTIDSILSQTFADFEFIVVNDGSTDGSQDVVEGYRDDRIVFINNEENIGQTASLNVGLRTARGAYLARTDAGDISAPERFRKQIRFLEANPQVDILGTAAYQYDEAGAFCGNVFLPNKPSVILQRIFFACPIVHVSVMARRERILALGGYDESYRVLADYALWARALRSGYRFRNLDEILTGYLVTPGSFGSSHGRGRSVQEATRIIVELASFLAETGLPPEQAEGVYRLFVFGPRDLGRQKADEAGEVFRRLLQKMGIPRRDIEYLLLRNYLKMLVREGGGDCQPGRETPSMLRGMLSHARGLFSVRIFEDACERFRITRSRSVEESGMKTPVFLAGTAGGAQC